MGDAVAPISPLAPLPPWLGEPLWQAAVFVSRPEVGCVLAGAAAGMVVGTLVHRAYQKRAAVLPYIPSLSEALDGPHDEFTKFFAGVHEMTMCVTDAWNAVQARRSGRASVEAVIRADELATACRTVQGLAPAIEHRLSGFSDVAHAAVRAHDALGAAWTYDYNHNYRTEFYTVTTRDSEGRTRTETRSRQVYENTDHYFSFDPDAARRSKVAVAQLLQASSERALHLPDLARLKVRVAALAETERMFLRRMVRDTVLEDAEADVGDADVERVANQWLLGTDIDQNLQSLLNAIPAVRSDHSSDFATILGSRTSYHYLTTSRTHSGPAGYRAAKRMAGELHAVFTPWYAVRRMLSACVEAADTLSHWADDRENEESDAEYVKKAAEAYEIAFPSSSLEIDQLPKHGWTIAAVLGTAVLVALPVYMMLGGTF